MPASREIANLAAGGRFPVGSDPRQGSNRGVRNGTYLLERRQWLRSV